MQKPPSDSVKIHLCSFADDRMKNARLRVERQALRSKLFQSVTVGGEALLSEAFVRTYKDLLQKNVRGFGFWVWKPFIIQQTLAKLNNNELLVYIDAGCHINAHGQERLTEYCELLLSSNAAVLAFDLDATHPESHWTKGDVFDHFNCRNNSDVTTSPQIQSGVLIFKKCTKADRFIESWEAVFAHHFHLVDDSPSTSENLPGFKAHRHDQSVFSILCKLHGYVGVSVGETHVNDGNWSRLNDFPFWVKRDRGQRRSNFMVLLKVLQRRLSKNR